MSTCPIPKLEAEPCYKCNEEGHFPRDCPNGTLGSRIGNCYKCNEEGHLARDCPNPNLRSRSNLCYKCYGEDHMPRDCPNVNLGSRFSGGPSGNRPPVCYNCKQEGHSPRLCPDVEFDSDSDGDGEGQLSVGSTSSSRPGPCRICGEEGHEAVDCDRPLCYVCSQQGHEGKDCLYQVHVDLDLGEDWVSELCGVDVVAGPSSKMKCEEGAEVDEHFPGEWCGKCGDPGHITGNCPNVDPLCN